MIAEFITYLQGAGLTPDVRFAFTSDPIADYSDELPVIMVFPGDHTVSPNGYDNLVTQEVTVQVVCDMGCAVASHEGLLAQLRGKAIGWVHGSYDAMELAQGAVLGVTGGYIWWREIYTTRVHIRQST